MAVDAQSSYIRRAVVEPEPPPASAAPARTRARLFEGPFNTALTLVSIVIIVALAMCAPEICLAQASPFMTGASALQTNILAWLTPIAIILIMVLGGMAMANRMSWGWCIGAILGIAIAFGAPQIVTWVRSMFGV